MEIRHLTKQEFELARDLRLYSFYDWTDTPSSKEELSYFTVGEFLGVFHNNELVSILRNITLRQSIRGSIKNMGGIASVSTPPEHRRKGFVRALMHKTFNDMKNKKQSVSMLWPFKESFYESFGYVSVCSGIIVNLPIRALTHYLTASYTEKTLWEEKRYRTKDVKNKVDRFKHTLVTSFTNDYNGMVLLDDVSEGVWETKSKNQTAVFIERNGNTEAYARYSKLGFHTEGILKITESLWRSIEGRIRLFRYFAKHIDQVTRVQMHFPFHSKFQLWFKDNPDKYIVNIPPFPWMVRVIDVCEAVSGLSVPDDKTRTVIAKITDSHCEWNNRTVKIYSQEGKLCIENTKQRHQLTIDIKGLSSLVYGIEPLGELIFKGWMDSGNKCALSILSEWFPVLPFNNTFYY